MSGASSISWNLERLIFYRNKGRPPAREAVPGPVNITGFLSAYNIWEGLNQPISSCQELNAMPRSDEAEWWFNAVYEAVKEVPFGKVTSYGHIARLLGRRESISDQLIPHIVLW